MPNNLDMGGFGSSGMPVRSGLNGAVRVELAPRGAPATTYPIEVTIGGRSAFRVNGNGNIYQSSYGFSTNTQFEVGSAAFQVAGYVQFHCGGSLGQPVSHSFNYTGSVGVISGGSWNWASGSSGLGPYDVSLYRHAAGVLIQRNGTNAQQSILSRSWTDNSNYSWYRTAWNTSTLLMMAEGAGTGTDGSVAFNDAVLSTSATVGFVMLPSCAGTPTGVPADIPTGQCPAVIDSSANRIWIYLGGVWKYATLT